MVKRLVFDFDYCKYAIAAACEKRDIVVIHNRSGNEKVFKNRTEFYGNWRTKNEGWLGDINKGRTTPWTVDDFTIVDRQTPEPVSFMMQTVKNHIKKITDKLSSTSYYGYIGKGDSWRVEASTLIKYKGQRADTIKPLMIGEIEEYLLKRCNGEVVRGLEADDQCVIDCTKNPALILVGIDKDYLGVPLTFFNPDKMDEPFKIEGFGKLALDEKKAVRGYGYIFFLFQVLSGDSSDNYFANSATDKKWGDMTAFKLLSPCANEKEAWEAVIKGYKTLYPEPRLFTGWRGEEFEIDARYVLNENCVMAKMMEHASYKFDLEKTLQEFNVKY